MLLVLIGPNWRLSDAVELELTEALESGISVVPVLFRGARVEDFARQLPSDLAGLAEINGAAIDHDTWERDVAPLVTFMQKKIGTPSSARSLPSVDRSEFDAPSEGVDRADGGLWSAGFTTLTLTQYLMDLTLSTSHSVEFRLAFVRDNEWTIDGNATEPQESQAGIIENRFEFLLDDAGNRRRLRIETRERLRGTNVRVFVDDVDLGQFHWHAGSNANVRQEGKPAKRK